MNTLARTITIAISLGISSVSLNSRAAAAETPQSEQASAIANIVQKAMKSDHLRAAIVRTPDLLAAPQEAE